MPESGWLVAGVLIGFLVGVAVGRIISDRLVGREGPASVVFERDEKGRILGIYYAPEGKTT